MSDIFRFLRTQWRWLAAVFAVIFGVLVLTQATEYGRTLLAKHGLVKTQAQAETQRSISRAKSTARYQRYQLDSAVRATQAQQQLRDIHLAQQRDEALSKARPTRPELPAYNDLPRE